MGSKGYFIHTYMLHCKGKLFNRKRKPHTLSEKELKIHKFENYQSIMVRNSPALDHQVSVFFLLLT